MKDTLYILTPGFEDPAYPGKTFYCWHCALMEGVLASFPALADRLDVRRIAWPKPRREIAELLGEDNQSLPVLVLAEGGFINDKDAILAALTERHGFPHPHP
ncbi:glutathione S-transferase [Labrenzia sp. MBR-25]